MFKVPSIGIDMDTTFSCVAVIQSRKIENTKFTKHRTKLRYLASALKMLFGDTSFIETKIKTKNSIVSPPNDQFLTDQDIFSPNNV